MQEITTLRDETRTLILSRPISLTIPKIAKEINVSTRWVNMFISGKAKNPGVVTVETLNVFLKQEIRKAAKNV